MTPSLHCIKKNLESVLYIIPLRVEIFYTSYRL